MKILWLCLLFTAGSVFGQAPQPTPTPPFRLNLYVRYTGAKTHPDLAAFLYKTLRELPGVVLVDRDPDAVLIVNEMVRGNQYACALTVLVPANESVHLTVEGALMMYDSEKKAQEVIEEDTREGEIKPYWRKVLVDGVRNMQPMYRYGGGLIMVDASPKVALSAAVKSLGTTYVEKEHREYDYSISHPIVLDPFHSPLPLADPPRPPAPKAKPTPESWTPLDHEFRFVDPPVAPVSPVPLSPDPFPVKP